MDKASNLPRLLQLASPLLPVGAFCYSQGLEWAIESGDVRDSFSTQEWIEGVLENFIAYYELPFLVMFYEAWQLNDYEKLVALNADYLAGRDTYESMAEVKQMGYSLARLCKDLECLPDDFMCKVNRIEDPAFLTIYAGLCQIWDVNLKDSLIAYSWSWLENQVSAAMKAVPLGQVAGQKILLRLSASIPNIAQVALELDEDKISNFCPGLSIACALHETQYSRIFRS
jgi:urease accessory protein